MIDKFCKHRFVATMSVAFLSLLFASDIVRADVYVWEGKDGTLHFTDQPKHKGYRPAFDGNRRSDGAVEWDRQQIKLEISRIARQHGMDPRLIEWVVQAESDFDPLAMSHKGAMGLMQLMPETAKLLGVTQPFDPVQNLKGGIKYLRYLLDRFEGRLSWALAAYHAGETRVQRYQGIPPITSTRNYVRKILGNYNKAN